jgi:hypothetical protein
MVQVERFELPRFSATGSKPAVSTVPPHLLNMAEEVGVEPTTFRVKAERSAIELLLNNYKVPRRI